MISTRQSSIEGVALANSTLGRISTRWHIDRWPAFSTFLVKASRDIVGRWDSSSLHTSSHSLGEGPSRRFHWTGWLEASNACSSADLVLSWLIDSKRGSLRVRCYRMSTRRVVKGEAGEARVGTISASLDAVTLETSCTRHPPHALEAFAHWRSSTMVVDSWKTISFLSLLP